MFLKYFLIAIIFNFVVQATCEESQEVPLKQETVIESGNETTTDEIVDSSATETSQNTEITLSLNGSDITSTTVGISDLSTSALLNESENIAGELGDLTIATVDLDVVDNDTYNATETPTTDGEDATTTPDLPATNTEPVTPETFTNATDPTDETTLKESSTKEPTTVESVEATSENSTISSSIMTTEETVATTTTEPPAIPKDILCPHINETDIDPKYINETFNSYFEEFMKKNPSAKVIKSPGFPAPYAENLNCTLSLTMSNCTGVDIVIHFLDLNPFEPDSLSIRGGDENATDEVGREYTGTQFGVSFKIIHSPSLYIWFKTGYRGTVEHRGFLLTYSPYGNDSLPPTTTEAPVTIPPTEMEYYEVPLVVAESSKTNETWQKFKNVLATSASKYVLEQNLNYEPAHPDNVTINIFKCPNNWPNNGNCVRLQFSIALWNLDYDPDIHYDPSIFEYELSTISLSNMWDLYGRDDFLDILGIEEYFIPDGTYILLLWTGISLTIVVIFIGVLYSIWRIDIFREYRRMHSRSDDQQDILKNKSELDISMYPIPHQPYPTLFDTTEVNTGGYYDSHEINSASFQGHSFQEKPSTNYRHTSTNPFTPNIMDFNVADTQLFPDDEDDFGRVPTLSPRSKQKLLVLGAKRDESNT